MGYGPLCRNLLLADATGEDEVFAEGLVAHGIFLRLLAIDAYHVGVVGEAEICRRCDGELFLETEFEIEEVASPEGVVAADVVCAVAACTGGCVVDIAAHERVGYEFIG